MAGLRIDRYVGWGAFGALGGHCPDPARSPDYLVREKGDPRWKKAHARYQRSSSGGGKWTEYQKVPPVWKIHWEGMTFRLKTMGFKHTGIFPEQAVNWKFAMEKIAGPTGPRRIRFGF